MRDTISSPVSASNRPYSDSLSFLRTAICRTATLCAADPVKYCSAAPQVSSGTTRRSAWSPVAVLIEVLVGPLAITLATSGWAVNAAISGAESPAAARTSTSPIVSRHRRSEPAYAQRWQPGTADSAATIVVAVCMATSSVTRSRPCRYTSIPARRRSSLLAPNPVRPSSRPALIAAASSSTDVTPRSWLSWRARLGPRPGTLVSSSTPGGIRARRSSSGPIDPV